MTVDERIELGYKLMQAVAKIPGVLESIPENTRGNRDLPVEQSEAYLQEPLKIELRMSNVKGLSKGEAEPLIRPLCGRS